MALQLQNITHRFSTNRQILNGISTTLEPGNVYALMGSNGAGKTTLLNIITGFIKPRGGNILFNEKNITHTAAYQRNRLGIGRTFQDLRIVTKLTVTENIILAIKQNPTDNVLKALLPKSIQSATNKIHVQKAKETTEQFFLTAVQHSSAGEISYGQQKLLTLACCVANGASLLLLDEPVAGIQPEYRNKIAGLITQLKQQGKTILLIEHNTDFIEAVADKIFFLHEGLLTAFDNMQQLKNNAAVMEAYL